MNFENSAFASFLSMASNEAISAVERRERHDCRVTCVPRNDRKSLCRIKRDKIVKNKIINSHRLTQKSTDNKILNSVFSQ
jgi:hypothetical protein